MVEIKETVLVTESVFTLEQLTLIEPWAANPLGRYSVCSSNPSLEICVAGRKEGMQI